MDTSNENAPTTPDAAATAAEAAPVSRRALLGRAAGAAAAGAVGAAGVAMLAPASALATNGDAVAAGQLTTTEASTHVKYDGAAGFGGIVLFGNDSIYAPTSTFYPAAVGGWAGAGASAGAGGVKNGVYGYTDAGNGIGVVGVNGANDSTAGGAGVYGYTASADAVGVRAYADPGGTALEVLGAATFSARTRFARSGRAMVPKNRSYVDVTVPLGLGPTAYVLATLQQYRTGAYVAACRRDYPTAGKVRIYLNKVASKTIATPVAWFVIG
jgi:hypothetical protein